MTDMEKTNKQTNKKIQKQMANLNNRFQDFLARTI